jgi:predicted hotdog family 3-hydroxylacyl-ACP dehydratase
VLTPTDIARRIPHEGAMSLLDAVLAWDRDGIVCRSPVPDAGHALAEDAGVPAVAAIEYAAQAAALHGALVDDRVQPRGGVLAKVADVTLHVPRLDGARGALRIRADALGRSTAGCLYAFEVSDADRRLVSGRLMVAFDA